MVISECQQSIVTENTTTFLEDAAKLGSKMFCTHILDFIWMPCGLTALREGRGFELLPGEEKVGQFRVMNIVEKWRISYDQFHTPGSEAGRG